jgi:hypothetical protein
VDLADLQGRAADQGGQATADGAVHGVHPAGLLPVAVVVDQPAGQRQVGAGEHQGVEVAMADHRLAARPQHPVGLDQQAGRIGQRLQGVVAQEPIHRAGRDRQRLGQVAPDQQPPRRTRRHGGSGGGQSAGVAVDAEQPPAGADPTGQLPQGCPVAAAKVEDPSAGHRRQLGQAPVMARNRGRDYRSAFQDDSIASHSRRASSRTGPNSSSSSARYLPTRRR